MTNEEVIKGKDLPTNIPIRIQDLINQALQVQRTQIAEEIMKKDWECFEQEQIKKDILEIIKSK
jgi:hypothetical protein